MKKISFFVLLVVLAVLLFAGCSQDYMRNLKIINDTDNDTINRLIIRYSATESRSYQANALLDDHTIGPQESMDFKLGPYPDEISIDVYSYRIDDLTGLPIENELGEIIYNHAEADIFYEEIIAGRRKVIEATYTVDTTPDPDEYAIMLGGNGYQVDN